MDHPRSRGGLLLRLGVGRCGRGIIPARAGFTRPRPDAPSRRRDHPRSRGVYAFRMSRIMAEQGSSPLARGLRLGREGDLEGHRIIPARAGFTSIAHQAQHPPGDHPRSRGVYAASASLSYPSTGSSPLARGLPTSSSPTKSTGRIIPARAGFTGPPVSGSVRGWDHPRSRGVYSRARPTFPP